MNDYQIPRNTETTTEVEGQEQKIPHEIVSGMTSIIMPIYLSAYHLQHYTGHAIGSIREHTDPQKTPYEIIIVDDASPLKLPKLTDYLAHKYTLNETNLGYTASVNKGIRISQGEYVVIMNNDVMVFDNWLEDFKEALNFVDLVMACPMYGESFARAVESFNKRQEWVNKPIQESFVDTKDFSCVATKRSLFAELGLFDEQFKQYAQDSDFFRRMDEAGKKYASCKRVNTLHIIGASETDNTPQVMDEDKAKYAKKWEAPSQPEVKENPSSLMPLPTLGQSESVVAEQPVSEPAKSKSNLDLIRTAETGDKVFLIKDGTAHWVTSPQVLEALGGSFGDIRIALKEDYGKLRPGEPIKIEDVEKYASF